jgi:hypothetical protein
MRPIRAPNAKSADELQVSTVTTSFLLLERIPPTSIAMYTDSSSNLEEAHLRRHSTANCTYGYATRAKHGYGHRQYYTRNPPTEEDQPTKEALLPP